MLYVIVPLRRETCRPASHPYESTGLIILIFKDQMRLSSRQLLTYSRGQLIQEVTVAVIENSVHGVQAKPIKMKLLEPPDGICEVELPHCGAPSSVEVDARAPGGEMAFSEK